MSKKFSIITPSFNQGEYIEDNIKSVLYQKNVLVEHIIIDGGSTDKTLEILKKYNHLKWISEKDRGQTHALNKALELTTGDIIGWLNADDYYEKNIFNTNDACFYYNFFTDVFPEEPVKKNDPIRKVKNIFFLSKKIISKFMESIFCLGSTKRNKSLLNLLQFLYQVIVFVDNLINNNLNPKKINLILSNFRLHGANKLEMKNDKLSKDFRYSEGIQIFNKYEGLGLIEIININQL